MNSSIDIHKNVKAYARGLFDRLARRLHATFGPRLTPAMVTWAGLAGHVPIVYLLFEGHLLWAGVLIIVFGLFDTLDGALARAQGTASEYGMFLDASTDRMKELLIYIGLVGYFLFGAQSSAQALNWAVIAAVAACGVSLTISYVKAKGEAAIASDRLRPALTHQELNTIFGDGIAGYEVRIALLALGCLVGQPHYTVAFILLISLYTLVLRMQKISKALRS